MTTKDKRVVIEYTHRGYGPPDELEALLVECKVTYSQYAYPRFLNLAGARESLEGEGFEMQPEVKPVKTRQFGRWCPRWREVWVKREEVQEAAPETWGYCAELSPRAQKARFEAAARAGIGWTLARTWDGDRNLERRLKNRHNGPKLCPICRAMNGNKDRGTGSKPAESIALCS